MTELDTIRLTELAERKLHLLTQLREMSMDQNQIAGAHRVDELLALLSRKSDVIETLRSLQEELKPFQAQPPEARRWTSDMERQRVRELFVQSERMLAELLEIDNQTLGEMRQQREVVGQQLNQFTSAEAIVAAYGGTKAEIDEYSEPSLSLDG